MVTITDFAERQSKNGSKFYALILQGGLEMILSEESGRYYATAKQASVTSTFDEKTCQGLVGTKLPGRINRIVCEPFDYTIQETGEVVKINHRWAYNPNEGSMEEIVFDKEPSTEGVAF